MHLARKAAGSKGRSSTNGTGTDTLDQRLLYSVLADYQRGNFAVRMPDDRTGLAGKICDALNATIERNERLVKELERLSTVVGKAGNVKQRAQMPYAEGAWASAVESVNTLVSDLVQPTTEVARVIGAVAKGDLTQTMSLEIDDRPLTGEFLRTAKVVNTMVAQLGTFSSEVTRVAREVGTEGKLGGQAVVKGVAGTWKDLTDNVNLMAANLTSQVRNIAEVTTAVAKGDLSKKVTVDVKGEILELKNTVNTMVDQLSSFAAEVTRVAKEVGTEGKLGGQADVRGVAGTWKDLTDNVNELAGNLTVQLRDVSKVATAIASGDLNQKITVQAQGEILQIKNVINTMVDQLGSFASEVTRVAKEVGTDGKLGGQAEVTGVAGTWKDLTDNVNAMAGNLTSQVRNIADVTTAVARGDLGKKITVDAKGEILELKNTVNTMVDQLSSFASEVTRVAKEVGTEGQLGGQADVRGVAGTWKDLTDNVNELAGNLTVQLRDVSKVATAIATGDLNQKITVQARGEILQIKNVINTMVDQLSAFASEVTRVAKEVGTEGKLGGQAEVGGVAGTWEDLTDNVNAMAANLTSQVRNIADVTTAVARGDLGKKITVDARGEILELKNTVNTMVDQLSSFASEVTRVAKEVGTEGKLGGQADVRGVAGTWKDLTDNVNELASNLTVQLRDVSKVATAIATGDLNQKITVQAQGEILQIKNVVNTMTDQLNAFASEVTRVAREVGTEGKLGGQADVRGVAGTWRDLTDSVNSMAGNLTGQVRNIADVTTAIAKGDLSKKITVPVRGEILELKNTINTMVDQLSSFASEVTRVAREVGTEGQLGGQADVPGVGGTWKDLTDSVNSMAANLTSQVRNIAEVTTAVARGDLSKKVTVDVRGEILELKDTVNTMVDQLSSFAAEVRRGRHLEGPHRQRQPPRGQPHHAGARHRRSCHCRDQGRPVAVDQRRGRRRSRGAQRQHQRDDRQPARDHGKEHRAGLAEDQPGEVHAPAAGPARPRHRVADHSLRAGAAGADAARRDLLQRSHRRRRTRFAAAGQLRLHRRRLAAHPLPRRRRAGRPGRGREAADPAGRRAGQLRADQLRPRRRGAHQHLRRAGAVRRPRQGGHRAGVVLSLQRDSSQLPRPAHRVDRHRAQHDYRDDANGRTAQAVAVAGHRAAEDERRTGRKGRAAREAERRSGTEEPRNRSGPPLTRRQSRPVSPHQPLQIGVPGQHEP
jgi:HAMP domain-containing protein